jgi:hypothetical protein
MSQLEPHVRDADRESEEEPMPRPLDWLKEHSLPIIGLLGVVLLISVGSRYSSIEINWQRTSTVTGPLRDVVQVVAFLAGACWAYFKFIKERTYSEILVSSVNGRLVSLDGLVHLLVTTQIKNVGSSKVDFNAPGSTLILLECALSNEEKIHTVATMRLTSFEIFTPANKHIEPNETLELKVLISMLTPLKLAYRVEVEIESKSGAWWKASDIVYKTNLVDNEVESVKL